MARPHLLILDNAIVRAALLQAWNDSIPGISGGHEEGGFIVQDSSGNLYVQRWPQGEKDTIVVPPHRDCRIGEDVIVASFHRHPNTGSDYLQEPSETDKRAVRDDPHLKAENYIGEFVISKEIIYLVTPEGRVREIGDTLDFLFDE
ncbi:MAG TPA: DUF4329 domain-containing protein [Blastocatellia bacterium]|nr:DUF4329 domain-containing protein [Blastocatellia bacterium]